MELIIDGKKAVLKKGTSFDYVSENRAFSDADDYTLSISLPLSGCPENLAILGHVDRLDADSRAVMLDAMLSHRDFCKTGGVTLISVTPAEAKVQFLEGRSAKNFDTSLSEVYINELDIPIPAIYAPSNPPSSFIDPINIMLRSPQFVVLPWVNDSTGALQNAMSFNSSLGRLAWDQDTIDTGKLSPMIYLLSLAEAVCDAIGYSYDFSQWMLSDDRNLVVCNTLPAAWDISDIARALPHWSVEEFFEELEKLLVAEIDISISDKTITLRLDRHIPLLEHEIPADTIVDEFSSEISYSDPIAKFKGMMDVEYEDCEYSDNNGGYGGADASQAIRLAKRIPGYYLEMDSMDDLISFVGGERVGPVATIPANAVQNLCRVRENGRYYVTYTFDDREGWRIEVNLFGSAMRARADGESEDCISLKCSPAVLKPTDDEHGRAMFISPASYSEAEIYATPGNIWYTCVKKASETRPEYYDRIYLASWDGVSSLNSGNLPPCPKVTQLSLNERYGTYLHNIRIDQKQKFTVSWLSSSLPPVRALFYIRGKRYLCEKITATFTEDGMSQLLKGEFYPLTDE